MSRSIPNGETTTYVVDAGMFISPVPLSVIDSKPTRSPVTIGLSGYSGWGVAFTTTARGIPPQASPAR